MGVAEPLATPKVAPRHAAAEAAVERPVATERARLKSAAVYRDMAYRRSLAVADGLSVIAALSVVAWITQAGQLRLGALAAIPLTIAVAKVIGLYERDQTRLQKDTLDEVPLLVYLATLVTLLLFIGESVVFTGELGQATVAILCALLIGTLACTRTAARAIVGRVAPPERCLLVGTDATAVDVVNKIHAQGLRAELVSVVEPPAAIGNESASEALIDRLVPLLRSQEIERVILASGAWGDDDELTHAIDDLGAFGAKVSVLPPNSRIATLGFDLDQLPGMALLGMHSFAISRSSLVVKRAFDIVCSALALTFLAPLLLVTAIAIKLDSPGPVLFRQTRVGRGGRKFQMLKFRSMVDGADDRWDELAHSSNGNGNGNGKTLFKLKNDPRVTRVGRLIRRYSIDELPQLANVLAGQMSLVGPRPLIPCEDAMIEGRFRRRLNVHPGITGHWQILGSLRVPLEEMVRLDFYYVANWSLWTDVKLLIRTFRYLALRGNV